MGDKNETQRKSMSELTPEEQREYIQSMAEIVDNLSPKNSLFVLVLFHPDGTTNYVSSARRIEMPQALREVANQLESDMAQNN